MNKRKSEGNRSSRNIKEKKNLTSEEFQQQHRQMVEQKEGDWEKRKERKKEKKQEKKRRKMKNCEKLKLQKKKGRSQKWQLGDCFFEQPTW